MKHFTHTIQNMKDSLYRFSLRIVGRTDEAEDVVQEVFIKAWQNRAEWDGIQNKEAMLMRMTKNLSIDKTRSKHRKLEHLGNWDEPEKTVNTPDKKAEVNDTLGRMQRLANELPTKQKMVFQLREIEGKTYNEIADILEISANQVKVNLHRARHFIKQELEKADAYGL